MFILNPETLKWMRSRGLGGHMKMEECFHGFFSVGLHKLLARWNTVIPVSTKLCPGAPWLLSQLIPGAPGCPLGPGGPQNPTWAHVLSDWTVCPSGTGY